MSGACVAAVRRIFGPDGRRPGARGWWSIWALPGLVAVLALSFALLVARWSVGPQLLIVELYAVILALVATLDLRDRLVYPLLTYPATALAMILTPLAFGQPAWSALVGSLLLGVAFLTFHLLASLLYRSSEAFGRGDVMIGALVGAMVGLPDAGSALVLATLFGGLGALGVGLARRSRRVYFAYGPALCLGGLVTLLARPPA